MVCAAWLSCRSEQWMYIGLVLPWKCPIDIWTDLEYDNHDCAVTCHCYVSDVCPVGTFYKSDQKKCVLCKKYTFQELEGQTQCRSRWRRKWTGTNMKTSPLTMFRICQNRKINTRTLEDHKWNQMSMTNSNSQNNVCTVECKQGDMLVWIVSFQSQCW